MHILHAVLHTFPDVLIDTSHSLELKALITVHILYAPCICWQQQLRLLGKQTDEQKTMK